LPLNPIDIMVVDDNPANLDLLEGMLALRKYQVRSFRLGKLALAAAAKNRPDLILLDINMPEMNGYEVCEQLKSSAELSDVPVIFLSALNDIRDKVKAFRSGGVDYISKPFQLEEVYARVETHLKVHYLQRALKLQNESLEQAVASRTRELVEANSRLALLDRSKNEFLGLISHEFRTPLNGLLGVGEIMLEDMPPTKQNVELRGVFERSRRRILSILDDAWLLTQIDVSGGKFKSGPVALSKVLSHAVISATEFAQSRHVLLAAAPAALDLVAGDEVLLVKAFHALIETAVKFSNEGETVHFSRDIVGDSVEVAIESRGKSIPDPAMAKFFDLFSIAEAITPGGDLGLAAPMAYRILGLFDASVSVANREPSGIRLTVSMKDLKQSTNMVSENLRLEQSNSGLRDPCREPAKELIGQRLDR
jgi:two-component system, sensor histidine kinase and response regulator